MTTNGYIACGLFILAILVNSSAVYLQKRHEVYDRFGKNAHRVHAGIISIFWSLFIILYVWLETQTTAGVTYQNVLFGDLLKLISLIIFYFSVKQIGIGSLTNKDLFIKKRKKLGGIYHYVHEPMYTSYTLFILGSAFGTGIVGFYYLSLISLLGLQIIESRVEAIK